MMDKSEYFDEFVKFRVYGMLFFSPSQKEVYMVVPLESYNSAVKTGSNNTLYTGNNTG